MDKRSIIIHGPGRSGTTLLYDILSSHSGLYWISNYNCRYPKAMWPFYVNRFANNQVLSKYLKGTKIWPKAAEAYPFWDHFLNGGVYRNTPEAFNESNLNKLKERLNDIDRIEINKRLITKLTGESRVKMIKGVFSRPLLVYIDRDPRLVLASYYKQKWGYKNKAAEWMNKTSAEHIEFYSKMYLKHYRARFDLDSFDIMYVKYEALIENVRTTINDILKFLDLPSDDSLTKYIKRKELRQDTAKSFTHLFNPDEQELINEKLKTPIRALGY
ncbi:MAG: sulfotransferase [Cyclobacteriaceae bacterium]